MLHLKSVIAFAVFTLLAQVAQARVYTIGVEDIDYYPIYKTESGQYKGFARDLFDRFGKEKGYEFRYESLPVMRLTKYFIDGQVDLKFPDNAVWAKEAKGDKAIRYSASILKYTDGVMVLPARKDMGLESIKHLGVVRGFTPWNYLDLVKEGKVVLKEASNLESMCNQALNSRVDGAYFNIDVARYFLKNTLKHADAMVFNTHLPHDTNTYHLSTISHPDIVTAFDKFLEEHRDWVQSLKKTYELTE